MCALDFFRCPQLECREFKFLWLGVRAKHIFHPRRVQSRIIPGAGWRRWYLPVPPQGIYSPWDTQVFPRQVSLGVEQWWSFSPTRISRPWGYLTEKSFENVFVMDTHLILQVSWNGLLRWLGIITVPELDILLRYGIAAEPTACSRDNVGLWWYTTQSHHYKQVQRAHQISFSFNR